MMKSDVRPTNIMEIIPTHHLTLFGHIVCIADNTDCNALNVCGLEETNEVTTNILDEDRTTMTTTGCHGLQQST